MTETIQPLYFEWNGEAMIPLNPKAADRQYTVHERYRLVPYLDRSEASHRHEFAWLTEAWGNLPENLADAIPSPEHLRKRALIEAGYFNENAIDCGGNAAALRVAAYLKGQDDFALVIVRGPVVMVRTAKSQSHRTMDRAEFAASKTAVLDIVAGMIGVSPETLAKQGEAA